MRRLTMRTHKTVVACCLLGVLFLGVSSGAVLVIQTVQKYGGACDTLNGFPGVLQQAGFLPKGDCEVKIVDREDCLKHMCKVNGRPGHCVAERRPGDTIKTVTNTTVTISFVSANPTT